VNIKYKILNFIFYIHIKDYGQSPKDKWFSIPEYYFYKRLAQAAPATCTSHIVATPTVQHQMVGWLVNYFSAKEIKRNPERFQGRCNDITVGHLSIYDTVHLRWSHFKMEWFPILQTVNVTITMDWQGKWHHLDYVFEIYSTLTRSHSMSSGTSVLIFQMNLLPPLSG
jgi:hypothetical protein